MTERHHRLTSLIHLAGGVIVASIVGAACCHREEESFRGNFPGVEWQRAESLIYGIEMIRSTGREATPEDFDLPPDWQPPAGWAPPAGWDAPDWLDSAP